MISAFSHNVTNYPFCKFNIEIFFQIKLNEEHNGFLFDNSTFSPIRMMHFFKTYKTHRMIIHDRTGCLIALHLYILSFYARHRSLLFLKKDIPTPIREVKVIFPQNEKCFDHIKCILINCEHTSSVLSYF